MERLTERISNGVAMCWAVCRKCDHEDYSCTECPASKVIDRLATYEDTGLEPEEVKDLYSVNSNAIKFVMDKNNKYNALLEMYEKLQNESIKLPCKVGDTIYHKNNNVVVPYTKHCISKIIIDDDVKFFYSDVHFFRIAEVGKTVFLTQEEAVKVLEAANV